MGKGSDLGSLVRNNCVKQGDKGDKKYWSCVSSCFSVYLLNSFLTIFMGEGFSILQAMCVWGLCASSWAGTKARGPMAGDTGVSETKWKPLGSDQGREAPVHPLEQVWVCE